MSPDTLTPTPKPPQRDLATLLEEEERHHDSRESRRVMRRLTLVGPVLAALVLLAVAALVRGPAIVGPIIGQAFFIFTVAGKFAILQGVLGTSRFTAWELATLVTYMDITVAVVLVYNLPRLYRLKRLGPTLEELAEHGLHMLETRRWLARVTTLGVVLFVMFPLTGTGAVGGSVFGRLLGLSPRRTMAAIAAGAFLGSFGMAAFGSTVASVFTREVRDSWQFKAAGLAVLAVMIAIVWWRGRKVAQELRARREARGAADASR